MGGFGGVADGTVLGPTFSGKCSIIFKEYQENKQVSSIPATLF